ncbi:MAG TPA: Ig-like domain-containing protein [Verrucomicrobiae bacterium]|nr:Ig-like domain-containing protein [Verrucomicrobiae bacterium]
MLYQGAVVRERFTTFVLLLVALFSKPVSASAADVMLAWDASPDPQVVGYRIYYGVASGNYTNSAPVGLVTNATLTGLVVGTRYYFAATAFDDTGIESDFSNETSYVPAGPANQPPTLNALGNLTINESAGLQTVNLSGIGSGGEAQTLTVSASSSNPGLIPTPTVNYTSPNSTGTITFTPVALAFGSATITVQVNDGGASNNIVSRTFNVTVNPVNQAPTLNSLVNMTIAEDAGQQTVNLAGISSGASNEVQTLTITASSSNPGVIPNPTVNYTSPNSTGTLTFTPVASAFGSSTITVQVNDGAASNNIVTRTFTVTVTPVNQQPTLNTLANVTINEGAGQQTVNLSGISSGAANETQTLTVTASSSNPALIPNPTVNYTSPNATGTISFTPVAFAFGSATITVQVNDGGSSNNVVSRTFTVTVNPVNQAPTLNTIANISINEGAGQQTVNLSGISSGASNEVQTLTVTASSSNPGLIPNPTVNYTSPNSTGTLTFTPVAFANGSATITVQVSDGGSSNSTVSRTFSVTVSPVNQQPTLNALANMTVNEGAGQQTVNLSGISSGASNEVQTLSVTASSSNPGLIPNPTVNYTSPNSTGSIAFTPVAGAGGSATITVTVNDGGATSNTVSRAFAVTVNRLPTISVISNLVTTVGAIIPPIPFTVGDAETPASSLTVSATSTNQSLITDADIVVSGSGANRTLNLAPLPAQTGMSQITLTVSDGQATADRVFLFTVRQRVGAPGNLRVVQIAP